MEITNCVTQETTNAAVMGLGSNEQEMLNFAIKNGIIDLPHLQDQVETMKNAEILQNHQYKIWQGNNQKWYTYLPDGKDGRKQVKRSTKAAIEKAVIQYYRQNPKKEERKIKTFKDAYDHWRSVQDTLVCHNTVCKYNTDRKRYFDGTSFVKKNIQDMTEEDIKVFIVKTVKEKALCKKACKTLFSYIKNTIYSARVNKAIVGDPMEFLQAKQFYQYCVEKEKPLEQKIFSDLDLNSLHERFDLDHEKKPDYIPTYAVQLASLTGMRVGEIVALKWEDVKMDYIVINKSEKYDRITKEYIIDKTKNKKDRVFPKTKEIEKLFNTVKYVEQINGFLCEWVFADKDGRIHAPKVSSCIKNKCKQQGIRNRGIHSFRKTVNSKLKCNGVSTTVAASLLGHTEEVNEKYYTFDTTDLKYKTKIIEEIEVK